MDDIYKKLIIKVIRYGSSQLDFSPKIVSNPSDRVTLLISSPPCSFTSCRLEQVCVPSLMYSNLRPDPVFPLVNSISKSEFLFNEMS